MKKLVLLSLLAMLLVSTASFAGTQRKARKANEATQEWKYELETQAIGAQNSKVLKVWSFSKDPKYAQRQASKNAIHGVIFKGAAANKERRVTQVLPLVTNSQIEAEYAEFFTNFFADGGDYMRYVTVTSGTNEILKIEKRMYKVGVIVTVQYEALRKMLEEKGVVKKLGSIF